MSDLVALWQCEQVAEDASRLRVVWRREPTEEDVERVRGALLTGLDPGMRVEVATADRLDTLPSGKRWTLRRAPAPVTAG